MKKILPIFAIFLTTLICLADDTYRHVEYFGDLDMGCYEKLCNSYNCYTRKVSCFTQSYMEDAIKQGLITTFAINHGGRQPTKTELDALYYAYTHRGNPAPAQTTQKAITKQVPKTTTTKKPVDAKVKAAEQKRLAEEKRRQEEYERTRPNAGFTFPFASGVSPELIKSYYYVSKMPHDEFDKYPLGELNFYEYTDITPKGKIVKKLTRAFSMDYHKKADADDIKKFQEIEKEYNDLITREWRITQANLLRKQYKLEEKFKNKVVKDMLTQEDLKVMYAMELPNEKDINQVLSLKMGCFVDMDTMTPVDISKVKRETYLKSRIFLVDKNFIRGIQRYNLEKM